MEATYRAMRRGEEEEIVSLWNHVFSVPKEFFQTLLDAEPGWITEQSRVAVVDGRIVSSVHIFHRRVRGLAGREYLIGAIGSVSTLEEHRGKGHSGRLLQDAIQHMESTGCDWSMLFTGVNPHYERYGWVTVQTEFLVGRFKEDGKAGGYEVRDLGRTVIDRLPELALVHGPFNANRPLSMVRTEAMWPTATLYRLHPDSGVTTFAATEPGSEAIVGYLVAKPHEADMELVELSVLPGHEDAVDDLLEAMRAAAQARGLGRFTAHLPNEPRLRQALNGVADEMEERHHGAAMVRPIAGRTSQEELETLYRTAGAIHWPLDNF